MNVVDDGLFLTAASSMREEELIFQKDGSPSHTTRAIQEHKCRKAVGSFKKRLRAVCKQNGGYIEHLFTLKVNVNVSALQIKTDYFLQYNG